MSQHQVFAICLNFNFHKIKDSKQIEAEFPVRLFLSFVVKRDFPRQVYEKKFKGSYQPQSSMDVVFT